MDLLAITIVGLFGLSLIASGLYYQLQYRKLRSDPVLIGACYVFGGVLLASCVV